MVLQCVNRPPDYLPLVKVGLSLSLPPLNYHEKGHRTDGRTKEMQIRPFQFRSLSSRAAARPFLPRPSLLLRPFFSRVRGERAKVPNWHRAWGASPEQDTPSLGFDPEMQQICDSFEVWILFVDFRSAESQCIMQTSCLACPYCTANSTELQMLLYDSME